MSELAGVIESFNPQTLIVTRTTAGRLRRGRYVPAPVMDELAVLDGAANTVTVAGHGLVTGSGPVQLRTDGTLPTGISGITETLATFPGNGRFLGRYLGEYLGVTPGDAVISDEQVSGYYWVIVPDDDTIQLATSYLNAVAGYSIDFDSDGTGLFHLFAPRAFPIVAGVQAVSGRDIQWMPAGMSAEETLTLYTTTMLVPVMPAGTGQQAREPDVVTILWLGQVEDWTVQKVEQFLNISSHFRVMVYRTGVP